MTAAAIKALKVGIIKSQSIDEIIKHAQMGVQKKYHHQIFMAIVQTQNLTLDVAIATLEQ